MSANSDTVLFFVNLAFNLLLFGCLIAGAVAVVFLLIKKANPRLRYAIAVAAFLLAVLLPLVFSFTGSARLDKFIGARNSSSNDNEITYEERFGGHIFVVASETAESVQQKPEPEKTSNDYLNDFTAAVADSFTGKTLFILWILGAIGFAFRDIFALLELRKIRKFWREATGLERKELAVPDGISLYFGEESPATVGLFYPVVVLPRSFPEDLSLSEKRLIIEHELSHARWRDPLVNFILHIIRAVFWISPALWLLERIIVNERESAADLAAIANSSENESEYEKVAINYAATLVSVAKHFNSNARYSSLLSTNTINLYNGSILENRIRRLLVYSPKTSNSRIFLAAVSVAGSFIGLFFMPFAFQSEAINIQTQAVVIDNQEINKLPHNENASDSQAISRNEIPKIIEIIGNEEKTEKSVASNQIENKHEKALTPETENRQIPRVIMVNRKSFVNSADDNAVNKPEKLTRKPSEEDAKTSKLNQKLDELSSKVQALDASRKNLGSDLSRVRQKTASQIDSLTRQSQTLNDSRRKSN